MGVRAGKKGERYAPRASAKEASLMRTRIIPSFCAAAMAALLLLSGTAAALQRPSAPQSAMSRHRPAQGRTTPSDEPATSSAGSESAPATVPAPTPAPAAEPVKISAPSAILIEAQSGKILYQRNAHEKRNPASVTKIMTLIVAFDCLKVGKCKMEDKITISDEAAKQIGTIIFADTGEQFTLQELLLSVAVGSANDAAVAVAEHVAGSVESFVALMNQKAQELGMQDTHFVNTTGLSDDGHLTSSHDIALMSRHAALNYPDLMKLTAVYDAKLKVPWRKNGPTFQLWNNNKLLTWYNGADGMKTGWTQAAGYCLAATARRNGVRMISVVMGATDPKVRNAEAAKLLDWGFANYTVVEIAPAGKPVAEVKVRRGQVHRIDAVLTQPFGVSIARGEKVKIAHQIKLKERVEAPLKAGDPVGEIIATMDGKEVARAPLVSKVDVPVASFWTAVIQSIIGLLKM
jgi:D-alanyl-D-alanine carboxypeptidase (penicillin-binding protein 5/6)